MRSGKKDVSATRLWRLDVSRLEPGDVLLERAPTAKSAAIRRLTRGAYSHALIWMGNTDFMEAVGDGVRAMPYVRIVTSDPKRWSLLRLESDPPAAAAAAAHVRGHSFKKYNLSGAVATALFTSRRARPNNSFCSQLVADAYSSAGIALCPGKNPVKITPADLEKHSILTEAPSPFTEITDPDELSAFVGLQDRDAAFKGSSPDIERKASQASFRAVKKLAGKIPKLGDPRIHFPPGNLGQLIELLAHENSPEGDACASKLLDELKSHDYFDLLVPVVAHLAIYLQSQLMILDSGTCSPELANAIIARLDELSSGWTDTEDRYRSNYAACIAGFRRNKRALMMALAAMHMKNAISFDYLRDFLQRSPAYSAHSGHKNPP
jgi:uncharacterized protein YycO